MAELNHPNAQKLLDAAARHAMQKQPKPQVEEVWKSNWFGPKGDVRMAQTVVGKSASGFHPGLRIRRIGGQASLKWGPALTTQEQAVSASQKAGSEWVMGREAQIGNPSAEEKRMASIERRFSKGRGMRL